MNSPKKRRYTPAWLILAVGTLLSIVAALSVAKWEKETLRAEFKNQGDRLATALQQSIDTNLGMLRATRSFYAATEKVDRQEFSTFVQYFMTRYPGILAFSWSRRVSAAERQSYEQAIRAEGYPTFEIIERGASGQMVRAKERPEYFPVTYIESRQSQVGALGYDLNSESSRRIPLEKARDTGKMAATDRIKFFTTKQLGFLTFQPIYRSDATLNSLKSHRQNFQGVTIAVFEISDIVKAALAGVQLNYMDFYLLDSSASQEESFLSFYESSNKQIITDINRKFPEKINTGYFCNDNFCTRNLNVADRQWSLLLIPQAEYIGIQAFWRAWVTLFSGLLLTALVTAYLLTSLRHTSEVEKLVYERTTQAKQLREALQSLEQNMEMLDLASDSIIIRDLENRIKFWNQGAERLYGWNKSECINEYTHILLQTVFPTSREELFREFFEKGYWEGELIHTKRNGTKITVESRWTLQRDNWGNAIAMLEINNDITQRKQAEAAIHQLATREREKAKQLKQTLQELQKTQTQLIQTEKMSSLGQLVAGLAHEINNPVNFIYGNLSHTDGYIQELLELLRLYQRYYPNPASEIHDYYETTEIDFLIEDLPKMLSSMKIGAERIRQIVLSLRNFSRFDEAEMKAVDIHEGIDNTLLILQNRLKDKPNHPAIEVIKEYGKLPKIECYAGQLNQVFMNIITNAIDALDSYNEQRSGEEIEINPSIIKICTAVIGEGTKENPQRVLIKIADNGVGITPEAKKRLFDPFFTTKPVGKGTGLGLSISYQIIVEKHGGMLSCESELGQGTEFLIEIPMNQQQKTSIEK
ncbi:CHASE domain-containing protein [Phormidium sp. LEGE 05292]|uniref:CHASE domain-containing protein n=1 Tax=[Phormidium] sp. LEGE 05292 TaxID=767427 RepID=UPI0018810D19|nr:CHASE domain-containing protein [Phormidium sp. LEGE 05292]MBE9229393.1 CHASE domain-containing protein [Phormidium sp. LEGE 05292]